MPSVMSVEPPAPIHKTETFQGVARNEIAYKMVQKMGWSEGEGLGREKKGITKHIWTKKRADAVGIGAEATNDWGAHSVQTNTFNQLLAKLDVIVNNSESEDEEKEAEKPKKKSKKSPKKGDSGSDSEGSTKKKKAAAKDKKKKKAEASDSDSSDDSDLEKNAASTSTEDYVGRKAGRSFAAAAVLKQRYAYKRSFMRNSKDVKSYSSEDLSQILGFSVPPTAGQENIAKEAIKQHGKKEVEQSSEAEESESESESEKSKKKKKKEKKEKKEKEEKKSKRKAEEEEEEEKKPPYVPSELKSMVLKGLFEYGGLLTGLKEKKQDWEFNDETMEKIAVDAHSTKAEARKGLGFANDRPSKLGKDYEGKKMKFEDEEEEEEAAKSPAEEEEEESKEERRARKKQKKLDKKRGREEEEEEKEEEGKKKKKKLKKSLSYIEPDHVAEDPKSKKLKRSISFP